MKPEKLVKINYKDYNESVDNSELQKNLIEFNSIFLENYKDSKEIPNLWPGNCFGCSPRNKYGLQMKINLTKEGCFSYISISDRFCGFEGLVHGGIIATLLDEIAGWTMIAHLSKLGVTQQANINYHKPVATNTPVIVEGRVIKYEENKAVVNSFVKDIKGNTLAESKSTWIMPDFQNLAKITGKNSDIIKEMFEQMLIPIKRIRKEGFLK